MKEFSIITCSRDDKRYEQMKAMYQLAFAHMDYEIIRISDAKSINEGYIRGFKDSTGETVIFTHDDAAPLRPIAAKLRNHFRHVDVVGGAGTSRLESPVWFTSGPPHIFGQVLNQVPNNDNKLQLLLSIFGVHKPLVTNIQAIDGFWFAAKRSVIAPHRFWFNANAFDGFHLYDLDSSYTAYRQGVKIGVASDLHLLHASSGGYNDPAWKPYADRFMEKWKGKLAPALGRRAQFTGIEFSNMPEALDVMEGLVEATR